MLFAFIVLLSAFFIEGIGTYVSIIGLSDLFNHNPVIIALAIALDLGKIVAVSFIYKNWKEIGLVMKSYMLPAVAVLMMITSVGCFGYLSSQFQGAIAGTNKAAVTLTALEQEQTTLTSRQAEINKQISELPANFVKGRQKLMKTFAPESKKIESRLAEINVEIPKLKIDSISSEVEIGPILYIAKAFHTDPEHAVKWVILIIIFVFDPLAISLLLAANFLFNNRKKIVDVSDSKLKSQDFHLPMTEFIPHKHVEQTIEKPVEQTIEETVIEDSKEDEQADVNDTPVNEVSTTLDKVDQPTVSPEISSTHFTDSVSFDHHDVPKSAVKPDPAVRISKDVVREILPDEKSSKREIITRQQIQNANMKH